MINELIKKRKQEKEARVFASLLVVVLFLSGATRIFQHSLTGQNDRINFQENNAANNFEKIIESA